MPKAKKVENLSESYFGPDDRSPPPKKKLKDAAPRGDSPQEWTLEKLRKVTVNEFRGRKVVDNCEFYEKDGKYFPGKKGISLSIIQWKKLLEYKDEISAAVDQ